MYLVAIVCLVMSVAHVLCCRSLIVVTDILQEGAFYRH